MSSDDGRAPGPGSADYSASKAALATATESLAYEARGDGVLLHVVYPGWMPTDMGLTAVREGGLRMPTRAVRRTEERVSSLVLRRMHDPRLEINAAALPLVAPVLRAVMPRHLPAHARPRVELGPGRRLSARHPTAEQGRDATEGDPASTGRAWPSFGEPGGLAGRARPLEPGGSPERAGPHARVATGGGGKPTSDPSAVAQVLLG